MTMTKLKVKMGVIILISALVLVSSGCGGKEQTTLADTVKIGDEVPAVEAFGTVMAQERQNITLDLPGRIVEYHVKKGQQVRKGDILVSLDLSEFQGQLANKRYELDAARYELEKIKASLGKDSGGNSAILANNLLVKKEELARTKQKLEEKKLELQNQDEPEINSLLNELRVAEMQLTTAQQESENRIRLKNEGAISTQELTEVEQTVETKKMQVANLKLSLEKEQFLVEEQIRQLEAAVDDKSIEVDNLERQLGTSQQEEIINFKLTQNKVQLLENELEQMEKKLRSSFLQDEMIVSDMDNGLITEVDHLPGEIISPAKPVLSLINLDTIVIEADVYEEFIKDIKEGAIAEIIPLADRSRKYSGQVTAISSQALFKSGETVVPVTIEFEDSDNFLKPGFNVDVSIKL